MPEIDHVYLCSPANARHEADVFSSFDALEKYLSPCFYIWNFQKLTPEQAADLLFFGGTVIAQSSEVRHYSFVISRKPIL